MWNTEIVNSVEMSSVADLEQCARLFQKHATSKQGSTAALRGTIQTDLLWPTLVSKFVFRNLLAICEAKTELENDAMVYADYALGNAYKKSLDLKKHGDRVWSFQSIFGMLFLRIFMFSSPSLTKLVSFKYQISSHAHLEIVNDVQPMKTFLRDLLNKSISSCVIYNNLRRQTMLRN
jgi:hypothetical protein